MNYDCGCNPTMHKLLGPAFFRNISHTGRASGLCNTLAIGQRAIWRECVTPTRPTELQIVHIAAPDYAQETVARRAATPAHKKRSLSRLHLGWEIN